MVNGWIFLSMLSDMVRSKSENKKSKLYSFLQNLVVHLLVHVENAQDAAQDGLLGLLGTDPLPDVAQHGAEVASSRREASAKELHGRGC